MDLPKIMTFHPTMEEFKDFSGFIQKMENTGAHLAGLAKVIPPKGWVARKEGYKNVGDIVIPCPITQEIQGRGGVYEVFNMEPRNIKSGGMSVSEFQKKATSKGYETPLHSGADDLERRYWTNVAYNPPLYGADVSGSLYDRDQDVWNIGHLRTVLDSVFSTLGDEGGLKIEGVNTAYLYFGMWKSTFAWHTEDMDLYSINYLHFGAPKFWYVVPPKYGRRLERVAQMFFKSKADECPGFLRHKCYLLSPTILKKFNVPFYKIMQEEGQFMITFPYAYHAGFNHGYNCAESTNFATERWIEYGKRCRRCYCIKEMVQIDMDCFVKKYQPGKYKAWINDEDVAPHPEDDEKRKVSRSQSLAGCHKKSGEQPSKRHPLSIDFGSTPRKETKRTFEDATETGRKKFEHLPSKTLKTSLRSKLKKRSILVSCRKSMETRAERLKLSSSAREVSKETTKMRRFAARESCHERQDADVEPANKMCTRSSSVADDAVHSGRTRAVSVADFTRSVDVPPPPSTSTASRPTRRRRSFLRTNQKRRQCKNDFYTPLAERVKLRRASDLERGSKSSSDNDSDAPELEKVDASRPTEHRPSDERSSSASETASQTIGEAQDVHTKCQMSGSRRTPRRPIASVSARRQPIRRHTRSSEDPEKRAEGSSSSSDPEELQMPRLVPVSTDADPRILRSHRREDLRCSGEDAPKLDLFK